jgi:hypothetical protein
LLSSAARISPLARSSALALQAAPPRLSCALSRPICKARSHSAPVSGRRVSRIPPDSLLRRRASPRRRTPGARGASAGWEGCAHRVSDGGAECRTAGAQRGAGRAERPSAAQGHHRAAQPRVVVDITAHPKQLAAVSAVGVHTFATPGLSWETLPSQGFEHTACTSSDVPRR